MSTESASYRGLFGVPGFPRVATGLLLGRVADSAWQLVLVLFVLAVFHSAALTGIAAFCGMAPGKVVSPLAGALLDRHGRTRLVVLDYSVAATGLLAVVLLHRAGSLSGLGLCLILVVLGTTQPLSATGLRTLFPLLVPRPLWDRANAVDSGAFVVATLIGPVGGGLLVALLGPDGAVLVVAAVFAAAAVVTAGVADVARAAEGQRLWLSTWEGLRYVVRNPTLRGLAVVISLLNVSGGIIIVGVPVLLQQHLGVSSSATGLVVASFGFAGLFSSIAFGRLGSEGRERLLLATGNGVMGVSVAVLALGGPVALVVAMMVICGAGNGPCDIALFALRQRRTETAMLGRAMAVSMALNSIGTPLGAALAGALLGGGHVAALFLTGSALTLLGVALIPMLIPADGG